MTARRAVLFVMLLIAAATASGGARPQGLAPRVSGPPETIFDWNRDRCEKWDIPDAPVRGWRDEDGALNLMAGAERTRLSRGGALHALARTCRPVHEGGHAADPGAYDDRTWIASPRADGPEVMALAHVEYHGHLRPAACPAARYIPCWRNAIVELRSPDGGRSFQPPPGARPLVAALPYRYAPDTGRRSGYFSPSNVLRRGDFLYAFLFAERYGAQARGACLIRRPVAGSPADWRAWGGAGFDRRFVDPYREAVVRPGAHVCAPLGGLRSTLSSVIWHPGSGLYVGVTSWSRGGGGRDASGIYWTTSPDLVHWQEPRLLIALPLLWRRDCEAPAAFAYPSLLDLDSPAQNLDETDGDLSLFLVRMPLGADCGVGPRRDLVRYRVSLRP
jgi:hypothetical protein